ncbi:MAG: VOC family protein [Bdellovibrio sp.]
MKNKFDITQFRIDGEHFLKSLLKELNFLGLSTVDLKCDHLCFRVETESQYEEYKLFLNNQATLLTESQVNGRPISTFSLKDPFKVGDQVVLLVELPSPKKGAEYKLGFEHAEFIIKESFGSFSRRFPQLKFIFSGNKNINRELCLETKSGQAKFHHISLDRVIEIEKADLKEIIFDFDGTLIQSREAIYEINRIVFSEALGREVSLEESKKNFHAEFSKLFEAFGITCSEKKAQTLSAWGNVSERFSYELFDGVEELLIRLRKHEFNLHLWTARDEQSANAILSHHNLLQYFQTMSFATSVDSKPHSNSLKFDWKSAKKNSVLVIGDSPADIFGSKNVGAIAGGALWDPHAQEHSLVQSGAEMFFYSIPELDAWIFSKIAEAR